MTATPEERATAIESRVDALEAKAATANGAPNPLTYHLAELQAIKAALLAAAAELAEVNQRSAQLAKENDKLRYQCEHLKKAVREGDEKLEAAKCSG